MSIQIIPRSEEREPFWLNFLFYLSLFLVALAAASYFIFGSLGKKAETKYGDLVLQLAKASTPEEVASENYLFEAKRKIDNFSLLLDNKRYSSQSFAFLEGVTHPKVSFSVFGLDVLSGKISLSGKTDNFQTLAQQVAVLKSQKTVSDLELSGLSLGKDGEILFSLNFILDQKIFKKNE
jgi:hypothetical protein